MLVGGWRKAGRRAEQAKMDSFKMSVHGGMSVHTAHCLYDCHLSRLSHFSDEEAIGCQTEEQCGGK